MSEPSGGPGTTGSGRPSRRVFLGRASAAAAGCLGGVAAGTRAVACDLQVGPAPWPSTDGERRTVAHFLNTIVPGDDGQALFTGDRHPLDSGGDSSPGAWSACALDVFYDPFYGVAGRRARQLAAALDWATRLLGYGWQFHGATQARQLDVVDALARTFRGDDIRRAAALAMSACLGAPRNGSVTGAIGWPGPNGGYYEGGRHPLSRWQQPDRLTPDGNLP